MPGEEPVIEGKAIKDDRWHEEISRLMNELIATKRDLQQKTMELQDALGKVKLLSGYLPICASCKKIRDDKGYWQAVETYIDMNIWRLLPLCLAVMNSSMSGWSHLSTAI